MKGKKASGGKETFEYSGAFARGPASVLSKRRTTPAAGGFTPPLSGKSVPGAEPVALCMSCSVEFPPDQTECQNCNVRLSVVRKCPDCRRFQSAQHFRCIYCSCSFLVESSFETAEAQPQTGILGLSGHRLPYVAAGVAALAVALIVILYIYLRAPARPEEPMGQSYALYQTVLRKGPSLDTPPIKDLEPSEIVDILGIAMDELGNSWFRVAAGGLTGYARTRDLAPPKGKDAEKTFQILQRSLLDFDDPSVLPAAQQAVEYFRVAFFGTPHVDEAEWLLAERTRQLADRSDQRRALLESARAQYDRIAGGRSQFADQARQQLALLSSPTERDVRTHQVSKTPSPALKFSVVGGSLSSPEARSAGGTSTTVRRLTLISRTPIPVRLTAPVDASPGIAFQGVVDESILVNNEVAVPKGSLSHLVIVSGQTRTEAGRASTVVLQLDDVVIDHQIYKVSAEAVRIEPPPTTRTTSADRLHPQLPTGTRLIFRLDAPLVVMQP